MASKKPVRVVKPKRGESNVKKAPEWEVVKNTPQYKLEKMFDLEKKRE